MERLEMRDFYFARQAYLHVLTNTDRKKRNSVKIHQFQMFRRRERTGKTGAQIIRMMDAVQAQRNGNNR